MTEPAIPPPLDARYAPGEDIRPLVRSIAAGLAGGALALAIDRIVPSPMLATLDVAGGAAVPLAGGLVWPALWADALLGDPRQTGAGVAIGLVAATLAAFGFVYGQFRRFVPGPAWARGLAWAALVGLLTIPALLPRAATWLAAGATEAMPASRWLVAAAGVLLEVVAGLAAYGAVVGAVNPSRDARAPDPDRG